MKSMAKPLSTNVCLDFILPDDPATGYLSIPMEISNLNRKSFRDGYVYSVDYIEFIGRIGDSLSVVKVPEGYVTMSAWRLGFEAWKAQRHNAMEASPGVEPGKWSDFKVLMDVNDNPSNRLHVHGMNAAGTGFSALSRTGSEWNVADFEYNDAGTATTSTLTPGLLGPNNLGAGYGALIQTYGDTRAGTVAPDPNLPADVSSSWIMRTGEESSEMVTDVLNDIEGENDLPPYANVVEDGTSPSPIYVGGANSAPGGVLHDATTLGTTGRPITMSGGLFPCGLMKVVPSWTDATEGQNRILRVYLTRGTYKGVAAMQMGAFN